MVFQVLSDSNTNVNSMIKRRVSLFYRYPLEASHHMVCPCTLDGVCVVCPGTSELVGQHEPEPQEQPQAQLHLELLTVKKKAITRLLMCR